MHLFFASIILEAALVSLISISIFQFLSA